jgi:hypothetical protein
MKQKKETKENEPTNNKKRPTKIGSTIFGA